MKRLGSAELEIMLAIWGAGEPVPASYVREKLKGSRDWPLPAVLTSLNRLVEKGFLSREKRGRGNWYRPLVSERDYKAAESRGVIDRLYDSSFTGMVAALYDQRAINQEDLEELRQYLDTLEGQ